jgi:hypothetical protein
MEPETSFPFSQDPATFSYPDSYFFNFHFNIILLFMSRALKVFLSRLGHPTNIWWRLQIMKLLIMGFSPVSFYFLSFGSIRSPHHNHKLCSKKEKSLQVPWQCLLTLVYIYVNMQYIFTMYSGSNRQTTNGQGETPVVTQYRLFSVHWHKFLIYCIHI